MSKSSEAASSSAYPEGAQLNVEDDGVIASLLQAQEAVALGDVSSQGSSDGESSDGESEGSEKEEEPRTPDGQDKHKKDNESDDDKDDATSACASATTTTENILKKLEDASDEELSEMFMSLTIEAKKTLELYKAVKAMKVKRDKTIKKAERDLTKKQKAEQNKQTAKEERTAPFNVCVVLPDGTVKELEISKTMTVGGLRLEIGTRLMKTTKKATKSLRLVHGVDEMTAGSMRKTVGSFVGMGEHSRITVSLSIAGGGKRAKVDKDNTIDFFDCYIAAPAGMSDDSKAIKDTLAMTKIDLQKWVESLSYDSATSLLNILDEQKKQTSLKYLVVPYLDFVQEYVALKDYCIEIAFN